MEKRFVCFVSVPWPVREADGCGLRVGPVPGEKGPGEAMEVLERLLLECMFRERRRRVLSSSSSFSFRVRFRTFRVSQLLREPNVVVVETVVECRLLHCLRWTLRRRKFRSSCLLFRGRVRFRGFPFFLEPPFRLCRLATAASAFLFPSSNSCTKGPSPVSARSSANAQLASLVR